MKAAGFSEESEWRLIYMPVQEIPTPPIKFHPRRDFLAPFITLQDLWNTAPSASRASVSLPLVPAHALMVGPSGHPELNRRAMQKVIDQHRPGIGLDHSDIPYRSMS
jgi:hypothetical protein